MSCLAVSLIVLAGGASLRFGRDKALLEIEGQPMIARVISRASHVTDEVIVTVNSPERAAVLCRALGSEAHIIPDVLHDGGPLVGAMTGLQEARGELAIVLAADLPLVSASILEALLQLCSAEAEAVVPRWPNGFIEPLHAVYRTEPCAEAARAAIKEGGRRMASMLVRLKHVVWEPTESLRGLDPGLLTFLNINTREDLERIKGLL